MKKITKKLLGIFLLVGMFVIQNTKAQEVIAAIQGENLVLLDMMTGDIVDPSFITLDSGTPKAVIQVGEEIWISYQIGDKIDRHDLDGNFINSIAGGLDNIKGLALINGNEVWVTNAGTANGAPGNAIVRLGLDGTDLGFLTTGSDSSFDIIDAGNGEVYVSYIGAGSRIERRDYDGDVLGNIVGTGVVTFIQQIELTQNNDLLAGVFSNTTSSGNNQGIYRFDVNDGSIQQYFSFSGLRGVKELLNGEILYSNSSGIHRLNTNTSVSTTISSGGAQFFGVLNLAGCDEVPDAPTGEVIQHFCSGATVSDLVAVGTAIKWYDAASGGNLLSGDIILENETSYFASQTIDGCESEERLEVEVNLTVTDTPTGESEQSFDPGATIEDIIVSPTDVVWFATEEDALNNINPLDAGTILVSGETYYAITVEGECWSEPFAVTVTINLSMSGFEVNALAYFPNPTSDILNISYHKTIDQVLILNLLGQTLFSESIDSLEGKINLQDLPEGIYLVKIFSDGNSHTIRVVKRN